MGGPAVKRGSTVILLDRRCNMLLRGIIFVSLLSTGLLPGGPVGSSDRGQIAKLGAMVGRWKTTGVIYKTKFSHAGRTTSMLTCEWSPDHKFVVSDQVIRSGGGEKYQLGVFGYDPHSNEFYSYDFFAAGGAPFPSHPQIRGNVWIYTGEFKNGDVAVRTRTTDTFVSRDTMLFRTQYSEDGVHWVTMIRGKDVRVK